jgi:hypothetical protein
MFIFSDRILFQLSGIRSFPSNHSTSATGPSASNMEYTRVAVSTPTGLRNMDFVTIPLSSAAGSGSPQAGLLNFPFTGVKRWLV